MLRVWMAIAGTLSAVTIVACTSDNEETPSSELTGADAGDLDSATGTDGGGGGGDGSPDPSDAGGGDADAAPQTPAIRWVGRFDTSDPAKPKVAWPGARVIVRFSGTELKVKTSQTTGQNGTSHYDVIVDGNLQNTPF